MAHAKTVCIVDDDEDLRGSISSFFRSVGLRVVDFATAETFLSSGTVEEASCLITDLHMPGMNGLGLCRELLRRGFRLPVIVMTAYSSPEARAEASELGTAGFMEKPIDPEVLLRDIEMILQQQPREPS